MTFVLDIGGEGRYARAWNLNPRPHKTLGVERGQPIPRRIDGRAEAIPLPDASVARILLERAPLTPAGLREMARVIRPGGKIVLRHVAWPGRDRHVLAMQILSGEVRQRQRRLWGKIIQESTICMTDRRQTVRMVRHQSGPHTDRAVPRAIESNSRC